MGDTTRVRSSKTSSRSGEEGTYHSKTLGRAERKPVTYSLMSLEAFRPERSIGLALQTVPIMFLDNECHDLVVNKAAQPSKYYGAGYAAKGNNYHLTGQPTGSDSVRCLHNVKSSNVDSYLANALAKVFYITRPIVSHFP